ncbi:hypothetical protein ACFU76_31340, partial [Streptomyces sp. NPDC057539]|uniref:hypothetical protein n=1 Tax=Streptomyces sp. NPDC057539 TaxID=3346159 RepID=UPI0036A2F5B6
MATSQTSLPRKVGEPCALGAADRDEADQPAGEHGDGDVVDLAVPGVQDDFAEAHGEQGLGRQGDRDGEVSFGGQRVEREREGGRRRAVGHAHRVVDSAGQQRDHGHAQRLAAPEVQGPAADADQRPADRRTGGRLAPGRHLDQRRNDHDGGDEMRHGDIGGARGQPAAAAGRGEHHATKDGRGRAPQPVWCTG